MGVPNRGLQGLFASLEQQVKLGKQAASFFLPTTPGEVKQDLTMAAAGFAVGGPAGGGLGLALNKLVKLGRISQKARVALMKMAPKNLGDVPEEILEKALRSSAGDVGKLERVASLGRNNVATMKDIKGAVRSFDNLEFRMASAADNPGNLMKIPKLFDDPALQKEFASQIRIKRQRRLRNLNVADRFNVDKIDEAGNLLERIPAGKRGTGVAPKPRLKPTAKDLFGE
jgi:hypothetical protein